MNKYQEALDYLRGGNLFGELDNDTLEMIEELVDKETPMKTSYARLDEMCGQCGSGIYKDFDDFEDEVYCSQCGQRIEWEE